MDLPNPPAMRDFFVSYNQADAPWAEWVAWQLEDEGYMTYLQAWDFGLGANFVAMMDKAASETKHTLIILSPDFLKSGFCQPEWTAAFAQDPSGKSRKLLPVCVRPCDPTGLLASLVSVKLFREDDETAARRELIGAVRQAVSLASLKRPKPERAPRWPGTLHTVQPEKPQFPSRLPGENDACANPAEAGSDALELGSVRASRSPIIPPTLAAATGRVCRETASNPGQGAEDHRVIPDETPARNQSYREAQPASEASASRSDERKRTRARTANGALLTAGVDGQDPALAEITHELSRYVGPMATALVKRISKNTDSMRGLCQKLADILPNENERAAFVRRTRLWAVDGWMPSTGTVTLGPKHRRPTSISPEQLHRVEVALKPVVGPIAEALVKRASRNAPTLEQLRDAVTSHLESEDEKSSFLHNLALAKE